MRAKAAELTSGAATEIDKIRAIAAFVQRTNYISIQMNLTRGGGYTPHRAEDVLANNYGDCKDKATLMRALLKAAGIPSHTVALYAMDRRHVRPEWPSPLQFNHAIVAVRVSAETALPTVVEDPGLGRLLIFDPTDPITPVGDLPRREQGGSALAVAKVSGGLLQLPQMPASADRIESSIEAALDATGRLDVRVSRTYFGQSAAALQGAATARGGDELQRGFETVAGEPPGRAHHETGGHFRPRGRRAPAVQPGIRRRALRAVGAGPGHHQARRAGPGPRLHVSAGRAEKSLSLPAEVYKDAVRIKLPAGYNVDELPDPVKLDNQCGVYRAVWKADGGDVLFEQSFETLGVMVPARGYAALRAYFEDMARKQVAPVVLVKSR